MARHDQRQGVGTAGEANGLARPRLAHGLCQVAVRGRLAVGNLEHLPPDGVLEVAALKFIDQVELSPTSSQKFLHLDTPFLATCFRRWGARHGLGITRKQSNGDHCVGCRDDRQAADGGLEVKPVLWFARPVSPHGTAFFALRIARATKVSISLPMASDQPEPR